MKGDDMKRADPMILDSSPTDDDGDITWMCEHGYHGARERRLVAVDGWKKMFDGICAGTIYDATTGSERHCQCECHSND